MPKREAPPPTPKRLANEAKARAVTARAAGETSRASGHGETAMIYDAIAEWVEDTSPE